MLCHLCPETHCGECTVTKHVTLVLADAIVVLYVVNCAYVVYLFAIASHWRWRPVVTLDAKQFAIAGVIIAILNYVKLVCVLATF